MRVFIFIIVLCCLGCATQPGSHSAKAKGGPQCPHEDSVSALDDPQEAEDNKIPKITFVAKDGNKVIVCGYEGDEKAPEPKKHLSEFSVYSVDSAGNLAPLKEVGAVDNYWVVVTPDGVLFEELVWFDKEWTPAFQSVLNCTGRCDFSEEKCAFKSHKAGSLQSLQELNTYISGKNKGKVPDEELITAVTDLALGGNVKAQKIFLKPPPTLELDGHSAETFSETSGILEALKEKRCL